MTKSVRLAAFLLLATALAAGPGVGQDKAPKKDDAKEPPAAKKKDDAGPAGKKAEVSKGTLPQYWKQVGLTDEQRQRVYALQGKYNSEIAALETEIRELKAKQKKEMMEVLTPEQKKRLADIITAKATGDK